MWPGQGFLPESHKAAYNGFPLPSSPSATAPQTMQRPKTRKWTRRLIELPVDLKELLCVAHGDLLGWVRGTPDVLRQEAFKRCPLPIE